MIIRGWSIDGYGIFHGEECRGLGSGLTVVLGPNESGKSTLIAFVRGMLFGFPDGRSREPLYPPLNGGRHGGRLMAETEDGPVVIDREAGRWRPPELTLPDGAPGGSAELDTILGGLDQELFRSIFAFGLVELADFASLDKGTTSRKLFSAGITGAGRSAQAAIDTLTDQASRLLRPRGRSAIGATVDRLSEVENRIAESRNDLGRYTDLAADEEDRRRALEQLSAETDRLRSEEKRLERLLELWPSWHQRRQAMERLQLLPGADETTDPRHRLSRLAERLEDQAGPDDLPEEDLPSPRLWALLVISLPLITVAAAAGAIWRYLEGDIPVASSLAAGTVGAALLATWFGRRRHLARSRKREADARRAAASAANMAAAARDLADLRRSLAGVAERQSLEQTIRQVDTLVATRAGSDQRAASFIAELDRGSVGQWESELSKAREALAETIDLRDQAIKDTESLRRAREALEASSDLPALELEQQVLNSRLQEEVEEWRTAMLARGLVEGALEVFTTDRQPGVLERASLLFRTVTGARYERVVQEPDGSGLALLTGDGRRIGTGCLSRGAAEQLYICLRLALAEDFNSRGRPIPLLMDDVLVNSDPDRARGMADAIAEYAAQGGQVILFTCHPGTADLLQARGGETVIRRLG